jgi:predicted AAA+ superfamily ATPase
MKLLKHAAKFNKICKNYIMYKRALDISNVLNRKSLFLFGARQVGKTTFVKKCYPDAIYYDLLSSNTFRELSANPELIAQRAKDNQVIIIDEIQMLPTLLNEAQRVIVNRPSVRFIFTGSSARKLKEKGANLLGGRATEKWLGPLVASELNFERLFDRLNRGGLPQVLDSVDPGADLKDYISLYLQQEIQFEGLVRNIESFTRFLPIAALCNGKQINFTEVANDCQVSPHILREYFQILLDTFTGIMLPAYQKTKKRKPVASAKFYLFDVGVAHSLLKRGTIEPGTELFGDALEHLIILEIKAYLAYNNKEEELTYWRSTSKIEVDVVIGDRIGIEIKGKSLAQEKDAKGLLALSEEVPLQRKIIIANEETPRVLNSGVEVLPIEHFLRELWAGKI